MQKCVNCGHDNRPGVVYCENCGVSLEGQLPLDTKSIDDSSVEEKAQLGIDESVLIDVRVQGEAVFSEQDYLRLEVEGSPEPIVLKPGAETIFGRRDPATGAMPDVDLTPFAGYRMGVSRRHAAIRFGDGQSLHLWDLGSSNGTYLNGERLSAHRPYRVHDGDELRLGQMIIRLHFQSTPPPAKPKGDTKELVKPAAPAAEAAPASGEKPDAAKAEKSVPDAAKETLPPITLPSSEEVPASVQQPEVVIEKPEGKADAPTTKPVDDEQHAKLEEHAKSNAAEPDKPAPPVQPDSSAAPSVPQPEGNNPEEKRD